MPWFAVRCVFAWEPELYEERVTLWSAESMDEAIELAEDEARQYVIDSGIDSYLGLAQAYAIADERPDSGDEIFSLLRNSQLKPEVYLSTFFDTGDERQGSMDGDAPGGS